ncbi:enoyl-CoA hydratase [Pseudomonas aeruginosa]|uniref:enoyl-CoA hydratase n=1 Tax=Pseudomonas TaxID=286 RepID=UPI00071B2E48|nr:MULTISPECIES: enoyl-CoA hydratase [Pseudomonas]AXL70892.1 Methacrylate hydratase [Pseudomonas aeruginosa]KSS00925.1 enoyl-CoA hydratase [Pseudomonas aeruginosa]MBA1201219.1 enoyl-CoA hydratase [Pseudomonas capeferrum]MBG6489576.1 enoyl-CoA hydratase [Pseudomonas aeruginosa]MBV5982967.1 enoyl-CoA hydratase [Pseudomonas aeruginosa]
MEHETLLLDTQGRVGVITLNRPKALNALNEQLISKLNKALDHFEQDPAIGCIVITGSAKAFAAGADIKEMADLTFPQIYLDDFFASADRIGNRRKPIIAAVAGYALGGGCELALMCDFIYAADNARFGLPELGLGVLPALGGTQRLTRALGKAKAMELCLTGRQMDAQEAERAGLVARVLPLDSLLEETLKVAQGIAAKSLPATMLVKECVNRAFEGSLSEGLRFERRAFHALFATTDQKEGMAAFVEKRPAQFQNH